MYTKCMSLSIQCDGNPLSKADCMRVSDALVLLCATIHDLAVSYSVERTYSWANLTHWLDRPVLDIGILTSELKDLLSLIRDYDPLVGKMGFRAYKAWVRSRIDGTFVNYLITFVYLLYGGRPEVFRDINTLVQFTSRLTLHDVDWITQSSLDEYIALEAEMKEWKYPQTLIDCLSYIINEWLDDFLIVCPPRFSNGATAECKRGTGVEKKAFFGVDGKDIEDAEKMLNEVRPDYIYWTKGTVSPAIGQFVPKGINKKRFIGMEPTSRQFLATSVGDSLDLHFQMHEEIHVDLHDQTKSSRLLLGDVKRKWSTIDLSSASDTVTKQLIDLLLADKPELRELINLIRSKEVKLPNGQMVTLEKMLPMGSALCFPIECIVFAAVASYSCRLAGIPQNYRVYGDDIVIDSRAYHYCCETLQRLHFIVNEDKSYGPYTSFTEACGVEAYLGVDVSPCRLPRRYDYCALIGEPKVKKKGKLRGKRLSPQALESTIELCNRLYSYGLYSARRRLVAELLQRYVEVPFSVDPERGIYHPNPDNAHLHVRYNRDLQRSEAKCIRSESKQGRGRFDILRYHLTLEKIRFRDKLPDPDKEERVACGQTRARLKYCWVPLGELNS